MARKLWELGVGFVIGSAMLASAQTAFAATAYDTNIVHGVNWLLGKQQAQDGSWYSPVYGRPWEGLRFVQTSEAVMSLGALNQRVPQYYAGLAWIENRAATNLEFVARRVLTLSPNGSSVASDLTALQGAQNTGSTGNNGWGVTSFYQGAVLDTAMVLQALNQLSSTTGTSQAITFLLNKQLTAATDKGWALDMPSSGATLVSEPAVTAQVLIGLIPLKASNSLLPTAITNALATMNAQVKQTSTVAQIALAAIANFRNNSSSTTGATQLGWLKAAQGLDGSWESDDVYSTALALRAFAAGIGKDIAAQQQAVTMPDAHLRAAVNAALGRSALDTISVGELKSLLTLNASGKQITDLTGLQYATNLTTLDVSNNQITSFTPVAGLTSTTINESGNPGTVVAGGGDAADAPTLPQWGAILLGGLLLLVSVRAKARQV